MKYFVCLCLFFWRDKIKRELSDLFINLILRFQNFNAKVLMEMLRLILFAILLVNSNCLLRSFSRHSLRKKAIAEGKSIATIFMYLLRRAIPSVYILI